MARIIKLSDADNILLAVDPLNVGDRAGEVTARARIPRGHKIATRDLAKDEPIVKYGQIIGFAREPIAAGDWVHEHNVYVRSFERDYVFSTNARPTPMAPEDERATFMGYRRANGKVGTRNYIATLTSVNCSASVARFIADEIKHSGVLRDYPNIDGVISLVHGTGCGIDVKGPAYDILKRTQWGFATNPNVGGVLMVGVGCEAFQIPRAFDQARLQLLHLRPDARRHGCQLRRHIGRRSDGGEGQGNLRRAAARRLGRAHQVGNARLWRQ